MMVICLKQIKQLTLNYNLHSEYMSKNIILIVGIQY